MGPSNVGGPHLGVQLGEPELEDEMRDLAGRVSALQWGQHPSMQTVGQLFPALLLCEDLSVSNNPPPVTQFMTSLQLTPQISRSHTLSSGPRSSA